MITIIRLLLFPISLFYLLVVWIRNILYDRGLFKSKSFDIPTIVVGNLAVGGTGKSPMTEYLIKLLKDKYNIATLSRGYGRETKGFRWVDLSSEAIHVGDEPLQFKRKFPEITVAVSENRCAGVEKLEKSKDLIILDDAYQHRKLKPGYSILLFEFKSLLQPMLPLPTGNFRDNLSAAKRADIIVVTKCPSYPSREQQSIIKKKISRYSNNPIFYTTIKYHTPLHIVSHLPLKNKFHDMDILLFCGIANPTPLIEYLHSKNNNITPIIFKDHHNYRTSDYTEIINKFLQIKSEHKIILTTEKDSQRINPSIFEDTPAYYLPIQISFLDHNDTDFDLRILNYVKSK